MALTVNQVMTHDPDSLDVSASAADAARMMRDTNVGAALVTENGKLTGLVTDRDIVVRAIAEGRDPSSTKIRDILHGQLITVAPDETAHDAARLMREHEVRRLPVVQGERPVGIVSIGDLAVALDEESALADISAAPPNN